MSPSKFQDGEVTKGLIYGPRPLPLTISKDSHAIRKPGFENYKHNNSSDQSLVPKHQNPSTKRQPVIIYTRTPKTIHCQAKDFMALVQKLTGLNRSEDEPAVLNEAETKTKSERKDVENVVGDQEIESSASDLTDEKLVGEVQLQDSSVLSPMYGVPDPYIADVPFFTPNSSDFFGSSVPNSMFQSGSMANSISPSFMDFMKDY